MAVVKPNANPYKGMTKEQRRMQLDKNFKAQGVEIAGFKKGTDLEVGEVTPTGIPSVDIILGVGGVPRGTLVELCGESQSGKSYVSYALMASAQKQHKDRDVALLNVENSFYKPRAIDIGLDVDGDSFRILEEQETAEQYCNALEEMVKSELFSVIVVDSITALIPAEDYNKDFSTGAQVGGHARLISRLTRKLMGLCSRTKTTVVLINQFRMTTVKFGLADKFVKKGTGGEAVAFFTHMRMHFTRTGGAAGNVLDAEGNIVGGKTVVKLVKTRYGTPLQEGVFQIMFKVGAKSNPLGEFLTNAASRGKDFIEYKFKTYRYINKDTGEVVESKDPVEFVGLLQQTVPPVKRTRGDQSETAFDFICGRLKVKLAQLETLLESIKAGGEIEAPTESSEIIFTELTGNEFGPEDGEEFPDDSEAD